MATNVLEALLNTSSFSYWVIVERRSKSELSQKTCFSAVNEYLPEGFPNTAVERRRDLGNGDKRRAISSYT